MAASIQSAGPACGFDDSSINGQPLAVPEYMESRLFDLEEHRQTVDQIVKLEPDAACRSPSRRTVSVNGARPSRAMSPPGGKPGCRHIATVRRL